MIAGPFLKLATVKLKGPNNPLNHKNDKKNHLKCQRVLFKILKIVFNFLNFYSMDSGHFKKVQSNLKQDTVKNDLFHQ